MSTKLNTSKSILENFVDLVNEVNPEAAYTAAQFTLGSPSVLTDNPDNHNTSIALTGVEGQGWAGVVEIQYTRLGLDTQTATAVDSVEVLATDDQAAVVAKVLTALNLFTDEVEASDFTAPVDASTPGMITLTPKAGSPVYAGQDEVIELTIAATPTPQMSEGVRQTSMSGFTSSRA